jgi:hypothetical protein
VTDQLLHLLRWQALLDPQAGGVAQGVGVNTVEGRGFYSLLKVTHTALGDGLTFQPQLAFSPAR